MFRWDLTLSATSDATPEDLTAAGFDRTFATRDEAEAWLGQVYVDLQDYGVESVTLVEGETTVMGPMSLAD